MIETDFTHRCLVTEVFGDYSFLKHIICVRFITNIERNFTLFSYTIFKILIRGLNIVLL